MSKPLNVTAERSNLLLSVKQQLQSMKQSVLDGIHSSEEGIQALKNLSDSLEERLVAFHYVSMVIFAAEYLNGKYREQYPNIVWSWHPLSDEDEDEPDLTGMYDGRIVIAAQVDPAEMPVTQVSILMGGGLSLLTEYDGVELYYFVRSERMEFHARMKLNKMNKSVNVLNTESLNFTKEVQS